MSHIQLGLSCSLFRSCILSPPAKGMPLVCALLWAGVSHLVPGAGQLVVPLCLYTAHCLVHVNDVISPLPQDVIHQAKSLHQEAPVSGHTQSALLHAAVGGQPLSGLRSLQT